MAVFVRYGVIAGGVLAVLMFAPYFLFGAKPEWMTIAEIVGYGSMVLCLSATYFAMRHEQAQAATRPSYSRVFGIGVGVAAVAAALFAVATYVFYSVVGDSLPQALYDFYVHKIRASGGSPEAVARQLTELEGMKSMFYDKPLQAAVMFATVFVIGVVESALGAWVVRRRA